MRGPQTAVRRGGKPKYLLSGLLRCESCGSNYIGVNGIEYSCSEHRDGGACDNAVRVRRTTLEHVLVDPIKDDLLAPARVARLAAEMQSYYRERAQVLQTRPRAATGTARTRRPH